MKVWKVKEIINCIETDGWYFVTQKGSHRQFRHPTKQGRVTVPGGLNDELAIGTAKSILKQAGLE
ncbi:MAG: type II toxin-antitoxin system HicA family toxin [Tannerellaceae bacterium]|jgi:predicted RNA binding protein YcfA (HicA-like mRNA interferase family)|nr:type II toxin-antitoxin system HicA family toxin [Tannerellaceae bacterium]